MDQLPKCLVHQIIALLPFKEAVRFSVLSSSYYDAWRTFNVLEFNLDDMRNLDLSDFFLLVYYNLLNNRTEVLEKLSIRADFKFMADPLRPKLISVATSFNLRELELINTSYVAPLLGLFTVTDDIFHLKNLIVLKLDWFRFSNPNILLNENSRLKKLRIAKSQGIQTFVLRKNTSLEYLELHLCEKLLWVELDAPNLEHFDYLGQLPIGFREVAISPDTRRSLKILKLKMAHVSKLFGKRIQLDWTNLRTVEFALLLKLEKIDVISDKLEVCYLDFMFSPKCDVDFLYHSGKLLTSLSLVGSEKITGDWIEEILPRLPLLESLTLEECQNLKWVNIFHDKIKILKFLFYHRLDRLEVRCPMLESTEINYYNGYPRHIVIESGTLNVKLSKQREE